MLYYKIVKGKDGKERKRYYLTQGDTFQNRIKLLNNDGTLMDVNLIREVLFKLSDDNYNAVYSQKYEYNPQIERWLIDIPSETTSTWTIDQNNTSHIYEYQITYISGVVKTPVQERLIVEDQIQGE